MRRSSDTPRPIDGRLVLADRVVIGRVTVAGDRIASIDLDERSRAVGDDLPIIAPGFVDLHVHGFGGHHAMGGARALDGMAHALAKRGVTSFLPTAVSAPLPTLAAFAGTVRAWLAAAPVGGATPLGFNLEGPFLAEARKGAHDATSLRTPASVSPSALEPLVDGLRVTTIAPELPGSLELIRNLADRGVAVALGHSAANVVEARRGYGAGARSTTHLFNAMTGLDHRAPGLALAALLDDDVAVELIADGHHVDRDLWPLVARLKPPSRLVLVSDALAIAGTSERAGRVGPLAIEIRGGRAVLSGTATLAGSIIALDEAVRNLVAVGIPLHAAVAAASTNPLELLQETTRGRIAVGQIADLVELDPGLRVRRVMIAGRWVPESVAG